MVLNREGLQAKGKLKQEDVSLGDDVARIEELSALDYQEVWKSAGGGSEEWDGVKFVAVLCVRCVIGEDGKRIYSDDETGLLLGWGKTNYGIISTAVQKINGIGLDEKN